MRMPLDHALDIQGDLRPHYARATPALRSHYARTTPALRPHYATALAIQCAHNTWQSLPCLGPRAGIIYFLAAVAIFSQTHSSRLILAACGPPSRTLKWLGQLSRRKHQGRKRGLGERTNCLLLTLTSWRLRGITSCVTNCLLLTLTNYASAVTTTGDRLESSWMRSSTGST